MKIPRFKILRALFISPLILLGFLLLYLADLQEEKAFRKTNLITDRDYGYGVSGKNFLLTLGIIALIVITIFLLLTTGRGES